MEDEANLGSSAVLYSRQYEEERIELLDAVHEVLSSGVYILGRQVKAFEHAFAQYCGVPYGVGVDNGTNALVLALRALGVGPGHEVVTVANTAAPTIVAIAAVGARPKFVDVRPDYLMDTDQLDGVITDRTACIAPVHLYGQCANMSVVNRIARRHGLRVIEDCAQAHGATQGGRAAGSMSDASAFSFFPSKPLGGPGDGGIVLTADEHIQHSLRRLRFYGMGERYFVEESPGYNARLDEVQAAVLLLRLRHLDAYNIRRRYLADRYKQQLAGTGLLLPEVAEGNSHVFHQFVVRHPARDVLIVRAAERGVTLAVWYRWPVHLMSGFDFVEYPVGSLPVTEQLAGEILSLPLQPWLRDDEQDRICQVLTDCLVEM